jgi:hypothetical protein
MNPSADDVRAMTCSITKTPAGWLAISTPYSPIRIGVQALTEADALAAFNTAAEEWALLREIPDVGNEG